ncbi:hypothetical protein [Zavarzinella formosa]|uniref:hypothetical protein n=1 Tax=Zavarzinella formosa TaxID=360055 RepID=UPI0002DB1754|nr:hypothetical protein [Zavarzinella formosa]
MIRKFMAASLAVVLAVGSIFAEEIKAVFVKSDADSITVKIDDKEKTYKIDTAKKIKIKIKDEEKEVSVVDTLKRRKEGDKVTLTVEGEKVVGVKGEGKKKKAE